MTELILFVLVIGITVHELREMFKEFLNANKETRLTIDFSHKE